MKPQNHFTCIRSGVEWWSKYLRSFYSVCLYHLMQVILHCRFCVLCVVMSNDSKTTGILFLNRITEKKYDTKQCRPIYYSTAAVTMSSSQCGFF